MSTLQVNSHTKNILAKNILGLPRSAWMALIAHTSYLPIFLGANLFISAFIISLTKDLATIALFRGVSFVLCVAVFFLIGSLCKAGRYLLFYRLGFVLSAISLTLLAYLREESAKYLIFVAIIYGAGSGCYWLSYHLYKIMLSAPSVRMRYYSFEQTIWQIIKIIFPVIFGYFIWRSQSYPLFFSVCVAMLVVGFFVTQKLKLQKPISNDHFQPVEFIKKAIKIPEIRRSYLVCGVVGIGVWGTLDILVPMIIFLKTGSELSLGFVTAFLPVTAIITVQLFHKLNKDKIDRISISLSFILPIASLPLLLEVNLLTLIFHGIVTAIVTVLVSILNAAKTHSILESFPEFKSSLVEHFCWLEAALLCGRLIGLIPYYFLQGVSADSQLLVFILFFLSLSAPLAAIMLVKIRHP
jgi:YQGE family putative transporter